MHIECWKYITFDITFVIGNYNVGRDIVNLLTTYTDIVVYNVRDTLICTLFFIRIENDFKTTHFRIDFIPFETKKKFKNKFWNFL